MAEARSDLYSPVMGTVLELAVTPAGLADAVAAVVLAEIDRLSAVLSGHDPASELSRWRRGELDTPSHDLAAVLHAAERLHRVSGGAFHPAVGALHRAWTLATGDDRLPDGATLQQLAGTLGVLPYTTRRTPSGAVVVERTGDCTAVELDALAKGYVVDAAVHVALQAFSDSDDLADGDLGVTVNAGGDLRHAGAGSRQVRIEDPARPFDNAPPLTVLTISDAALATSGTTRRGYTVDGRRLGHVLDPRTGQPAGHTASASVLAADAMTADAVATAAVVLPADEAIDLVEQLDLACLLVCGTGEVRTSSGWPAAVTS